MKVILLSIFIIVSSFLYAQQYTAVTVNSTVENTNFWVGTLPKGDSDVFQKLKIEVFGGYWTANDLGTTIYSISTRGNLQINKEVYGAGDSPDLKVFDTESGYDFVVSLSGFLYASVLIKASCISQMINLAESQPLTIMPYDVAGKTNVISRFLLNNIFVTDKDGNIGIGIGNPQNKLEVNGTIRAKEVQVESDWADFVFDESYVLPTIEEVAEHIKEKKHLPGIPSAEEIRENGVSLGEINTKLLQKIEEQALYIIDLQRQIQDIKEQVKKLDK